MTEEFKRRLTAILSADVEGYSRLMREDEEATVRTITTYRTAMTNVIQQYRGRVVDSPGDNILAEFTSVVDAVNCAVEIQRDLAERNAELPDNRRMQFRMGINLGDVLEEGERIYGDGVNMAARMETLAEAGEICISGTVYDAVESKIGLEYEFLGEHEVKNIDKPIRAYRVLSYPGAAAHRVVKAKKAVGKTWRNAMIAIAVVLVVSAAVAVWHFYFRAPPIEPASVEKMAYSLPDKPSIAVLPFANMSGDPEQEYFSDGLTEEIITALSRIPHLFVIARNSTFTYKGKPVKIKRVAEEFGVRYVLEGSVRKSEDRVRITAQLIDAFEGRHLWAERYNRNLKDIFAIQDEITMKIITALQVKLKGGDAERLYAKGTDNLEAYLKSLQSRELSFGAVTKEKIVLARRLAEDAIALDPNYSEAYRALAHTCPIEVWLGVSKFPRKTLKRGVELAQKVIDLDNSNAHAHSLLGIIYVMQRQHDKGVAAVERAYELEPTSFEVLTSYAWVLYYVGMWEEALRLYEEAMRLSPIPDNVSLRFYGATLRELERYDEAIAVFKRAIKQDPRNPFAHLMLAVTYSLAGRDEKARSSANDVLRINPKISIRHLKKTTPFKNPAHLERIFEAMRKVGIPDKPPLPLPDKPSIAVLPFVNMSGDPEQEFFSDGITEEIITGLAKVPDLFVIARNSTFTYKGKPVKVQQVALELGVRYVLEGSVRKAGSRVRITAQLIEAKTGKHLWAERYDRDLKDIFALQDEITLKVITALRVKLTEGEQARLTGKGTKNLEAYYKVLQARKQFYRMNKQGSMESRRLAKEAIALDPEFAVPYTILALTHMMDLWFKFSESPKESMRLAVEAAQKALDLDDSNPATHIGLCMLYVMQRKHDKAIAAAKSALELSPSGANAYSALGTALRFACRPNEAIPMVKKAISLNPISNSILLRGLGVSLQMAGRYEEAIAFLKKALQERPNDLFTHLFLAVCFISLDREEEALAEAKEVLRIHPKFSLEHFAKTLPYKDQSVVDNTIACLRKAGLK